MVVTKESFLVPSDQARMEGDGATRSLLGELLGCDCVPMESSRDAFKGEYEVAFRSEADMLGYRLGYRIIEVVPGTAHMLIGEFDLSRDERWDVRTVTAELACKGIGYEWAVASVNEEGEPQIFWKLFCNEEEARSHLSECERYYPGTAFAVLAIRG